MQRGFAVVSKGLIAECRLQYWFRAIMGLYRSYTGMVEKKTETTIMGIHRV